MTATSTTALQELMASKKAEIDKPADVIDIDPETGEIVSASEAPVSPSGEGDGVPPPGPVVPAASAPAPVADLPVPFPDIPPKVIGGLPYAPHYAKLARTIQHTEMVPGAMRGRYDAITACFMRGYEMGMGPMQALDSFHVIDGKVGLSAEAMRALIINAGHQILLEELYDDDSQCIAIQARCHRADWPPEMWLSYRFGLDDARRAGLLNPSRSGKPTSWQTYPRAMMEARCTSGAGRRYFPDVLAGMSYTPEEIRDFDGPGIAEQEAPSSDANGTATGRSNGSPPSPQSPPPAQASSPSSPPAPAPETSGDSEPPCLTDAGSTDSASATSSADPSSSAPATPSAPAKKARGATKKAAPKPTPAPSSDAPPAPPPAASTPQGAQPSLGELEQATAAPPAPPDEPGASSVTREMRSAYLQIVRDMPQDQQPLVRAFVQQHFPGRPVNEWTADEIQKGIDIAVGWPDSIEQHPLPDEPDD